MILEKLQGSRVFQWMPQFHREGSYVQFSGAPARIYPEDIAAGLMYLRRYIDFPEFYYSRALAWQGRGFDFLSFASWEPLTAIVTAYKATSIDPPEITARANAIDSTDYFDPAVLEWVMNQSVYEWEYPPTNDEFKNEIKQLIDGPRDDVLWVRLPSLYVPTYTRPDNLPHLVTYIKCVWIYVVYFVCLLDQMEKLSTFGRHGGRPSKTPAP